MKKPHAGFDSKEASLWWVESDHVLYQTGAGVAIQYPMPMWREEILPGLLGDAWHDPEALFVLISDCRAAGLSADVLDAARQLSRIDPLRGIVLLAGILADHGDLEAAEAALREFLQETDATAETLALKGRISDLRGNRDDAKSANWKALLRNPNHADAFAACQKWSQEDGSWPQMSERLLALPASWRIRLSLAKGELAARNAENAVSLCREAIEMARKAEAADVLSEVAETLGLAGYLPEMLALVAPHFHAKRHGLAVGRNLVKGYTDLGQLDSAKKLVDEMHAENVPAWEAVLMSLGVEIALAAHSTREENPGPRIHEQITFIFEDSPIWIRSSSPLKPFKSPVAPTVIFLASSLSSNLIKSQQPSEELPWKGLSIVASEHLFYRTQGNSCNLWRWVRREDGGEVITPEPPDDEAVRETCAGEYGTCGYGVTTHLDRVGSTFFVSVGILDLTSDCHVADLKYEQSEPWDVAGLAETIARDVAKAIGMDWADSPDFYSLGTPEMGNSHAEAVFLLLKVACDTSSEISEIYRTADRVALCHQLAFCQQYPEAPVARAVLAAIVRQSKIALPGHVEKLAPVIYELLENDPLDGEDGTAADALLAEALNA